MSPYEEVILEHWKNPRNKGRLSHPDLVGVEVNPLCGDAVRLELQISNGKVADVRFDGHGCAISQAAASLLTELIKDKEVVALREMEDEELLSALGGVIQTRRNCALLPLRALRRALRSSAA